MTIGYEAVGYSNGSGLPSGFPTDKIDNVKSPLRLKEDGTFAGDPQDDQVSTNLQTSTPIPPDTAVKQVNSYQNTNQNITTGTGNASINSTIASALTNLNSTDATSNLNVSFNVKDDPAPVQASQIQL
jgi:hypothetical protein